MDFWYVTTPLCYCSYFSIDTDLFIVKARISRDGDLQAPPSQINLNYEHRFVYSSKQVTKHTTHM